MKITAICALSLAALLTACGSDDSSSDDSYKSSTMSAEQSAKASAALRTMGRTPAKEIFGHIQNPNGGPAESIGFYSRGCISGAQQLPETGPTWQAMRLSRNRNYGHPQLIDFIEKLSQQARAQAGWAGLYVGDMSQPRGGPMLSGHASHQVGLDADIWMLPPQRLNLSRSERESISSVSVVTDDYINLSKNWTDGHFKVLRAAAQDSRVERIL